MVRLAWAGIGVLWLSAGAVLVLIVVNAEAALDRLAAPEIAGVILDRSTTGQVERGRHSHWYRNSKLIGSFEIPPTQVLSGMCDGATPCPMTLHENEPAIALSLRTLTRSNLSQSLVHPFPPRNFHAVLTNEVENANRGTRL